MGSNPTFGSSLPMQGLQRILDANRPLRVNGRSESGAAPGFRWSTVVILTLSMGIAVTISWFAFLRALDSYGPELDAMLRPARLAVYATQFAIIIPFSYWLGRRRLGGASAGALAATAVAGWLLEGIILTIIGEPLVANELDPGVAWYYWLAATAGPLQPAVAFAGSRLGARSVPTSPRGRSNGLPRGLTPGSARPLICA